MRRNKQKTQNSRFRLGHNRLDTRILDPTMQLQITVNEFIFKSFKLLDLKKIELETIIEIKTNMDTNVDTKMDAVCLASTCSITTPKKPCNGCTAARPAPTKTTTTTTTKPPPVKAS